MDLVTNKRQGPPCPVSTLLLLLLLSRAAGWPRGGGTVVVVGHQPGLGAAAALAVTGKAAEWRMKKGGVWWISVEEGEASPVVVAVMTPDLL